MDYESLLQTLQPTEEEMQEVRKATQELITALETESTKQHLDVVLTPGGSTAKGTNLAGNFDVDMFVRFKTPGKLDDLLEKILTPVSTMLDFSLERVHGSRDYFTFTFQNFFFELVPVKFVTDASQAENVTDMSPLHVEWAKEKLTPELANDIRLAKQFCKAAKVYGAESFINGVSGHVLDILIIHYKGFENFLHAVSTWKGTTIIDPENQHDNVLKNLNQSKLDSPLILIDPIDKERNAAAALSLEKYKKLIHTAKAFLQHQDISFFEITYRTVEELQEQKEENDELFIIEALPLQGKKDIVYTKLLKVFEFLKRHLQLAEFRVRKSGWDVQETKALMYFYTDATPLDETFLRQGPPANQEKDVARFIDANPDAFEQNGFWCTMQEREFTHAHDYLDKLLKENFVRSRSKKTSLKQI